MLLGGGRVVNKFRLSEQKKNTQDCPGPPRIEKDLIWGGPGPSGAVRSTSVFGVTVALLIIYYHLMLYNLLTTQAPLLNEANVTLANTINAYGIIVDATSASQTGCSYTPSKHWNDQN